MFGMGSSDKAIPPVSQLKKPEPLSATIEREKAKYDCLPCRITGAAALIGLGAYSYFSGNAQLKQQETKILKSGSMFGMRTRQLGVRGIALSLVGMGLWRLVN